MPSNRKLDLSVSTSPYYSTTLKIIILSILLIQSISQTPCTSYADCSNSEPRCENSYCSICLSDDDCTGLFGINNFCNAGQCLECASYSQCTTPAKPICNTISGTCEGCTSDLDCSNKFSVETVCYSQTGSCVECIDETYCTSENPRCDNGYCSACLSDGDCAGLFQGKDHCDGTKCVECLTDTDCTSPATPLCELSTNTCVGCSTNTDCSNKFSLEQLCSSPSGACVQCIDYSNCTSENPRCDNGYCSACLSDGDCAGIFQGKDRCSSAGSCVECLGDNNCPRPTVPVCELSTNTCTGCSTDTDCISKFSIEVWCSSLSGPCVGCIDNNYCLSSDHPVCNGGYCSSCLSDNDCLGRFNGKDYCNSAGSCVECLSDNNCPTLTVSVCELSTNTCTGCSTDTDCISKFSVEVWCSSPSGFCVECIDNTYCLTADNPVCSGGYCSSCLSDNDCLGRFNGKDHCSAGQCVECLSDSDCMTPAAPVCELSTNTCIGCLTGTDCSNKFSLEQICSYPSGPCVQCIDNSYCTAEDNPLCNSGYCSGCVSDDDCTGRFSGRDHCDGTKCVECVTDTDCTSPAAPLCELSTNTCVGCLTNADCSNKFSLEQLCSSPPGACVQCIDYSNCTSENPRCDNGYCSSCLSDGDCAGLFQGKDHCDETKCVECLSNRDCISPAAPLCDLSTNTCSGCLTNVDCNNKFSLEQLCSYPLGPCVQCIDNSYCTTEVNPNCNAGYCSICVSDDDCTGRFNGKDHCSSAGSCVECLSDNDCPSPTVPVCKLSANSCTGCSTNTDCSNKFSVEKYCASLSGPCVECIDNSYCLSYDNPTCSGGYCSGCLSDGDCTGRFGGKDRCDGQSCVECLSDSDCMTPAAPVCELSTNTCIGCLNGTDCSNKFSIETICSAVYGPCVQCIDNSVCTTEVNPHCDSGYCTGCISNYDCTGRFNGKDVCNGNACVECTSSSQCTTLAKPVCDTTTYEICIGCSTGADCSSKFSVETLCSTNGSCVQCNYDNDCLTAVSPVCSNGYCSSCQADADCNGRFSGKDHCSADGRCVVCAETSQCTSLTLPVCDGSTNTCIICSTGTDCSSKFSVEQLCSTTNGSCVECNGNSDCTTAVKPHCSAGYCASCQSDSDCTGRFSGKNLCSAGQCVECIATSDCTSTADPVCDTVNQVCIGCTSGTDCSSKFSVEQLCLSSGTCVQCTDNSYCPTYNEPRCNSYSCDNCVDDTDCGTRFSLRPYCGLGGECAQCRDNTQCTDYTLPKCSADVCVGCTDNIDCGARFSPNTLCLTGQGQCVECIYTTDCTSSLAPHCSLQNQCTNCTGDSDCLGRFNGLDKCRDDGQCVECLTDSDCGSPDKAQCANNVCTSCTSDTQCQHLYGSTALCRLDQGGICGNCPDNTPCTSYFASQCLLLPTTGTPIKSECSPCLTNAGCSLLTGHTYCNTVTGSGVCGACIVQEDCTNASASQCDSVTSPSVCTGCSDSTYCTHISGLPACVSGVCKECGAYGDSTECQLPTKPYCDLTSYTCGLCLNADDTACTHLTSTPYCTVSGICKQVKAIFQTPIYTRVIPEKDPAFSIGVTIYPSNNPSYTWVVQTDHSVPPLTKTQLLLTIPAFPDLTPRPSTMQITYTTMDASSNSDTITTSFIVNHPPNGGTLTISPSTGAGRGLDTSYTLTTTGWTDAESDTIYYRFYYTNSEDFRYILMYEQSTTASFTTQLAAGALANDYVVYFKLFATDIFESESYVEKSTTIQPAYTTIAQCITVMNSFASTLQGSIDAVRQGTMIADLIAQAEKDLLTSPDNACPICSDHGSCSGTSTVCVCNSGYTLPGCTITQTELNQYISLKTTILTQISSVIAAQGITQSIAEQAIHIFKQTTSSSYFTTSSLITSTYTILTDILSRIMAQPLELSLGILADLADTIENLSSYTFTDCSRASTDAPNIQTLLNYLSAITISNLTTTASFSFETDTFFVCMQKGVSAQFLVGTQTICPDINIQVEFPTTAVSSGNVDFVVVYVKPSFSECSTATFNKILVKNAGTLNIVAFYPTVTFATLSPLSIICPNGQNVVENAAGDLICQQIATVTQAIQDVQGLITGSNLQKIMNFGALADFDFLGTPLFYIVVGFTLVMIGISIWAVLKDRSIDRDLLKLPEKVPSRLYKLSVYVMITHTFFGIFVLYDKKNPRLMRSVMFYTKILGLMALSAIFSQTQEDMSSIKKIALSIITLSSTAPLNFVVSYVTFKRHIQPKLRRKRLERQMTQKAISQDKLKREKQKKLLDKSTMAIGYVLLIVILLAYVYIIFVITANNIQSDDQVVTRWLIGFLQSTALDFFGIQIGKVFLHLGMITALQNSSKKKFLCIPRRHLPRMLNPLIFDFQKRFALLERLYKKPDPNKLPLPNLDDVDAISSSNRFGSRALSLGLNSGLADPGLEQKQKEQDARKERMQKMRMKMNVPLDLNANNLAKSLKAKKEAESKEKAKLEDDDIEVPEQAKSLNKQNSYYSISANTSPRTTARSGRSRGRNFIIKKVPAPDNEEFSLPVEK